jgi:hypothetical protein
MKSDSRAYSGVSRGNPRYSRKPPLVKMQLECHSSTEMAAIINPTVLNMSGPVRISRTNGDQRVLLAQFHQAGGFRPVLRGAMSFLEIPLQCLCSRRLPPSGLLPEAEPSDATFVRSRGFNISSSNACLEERLKTSHSFHRRNRLTWAQTFLSVLALVCAAALLVSAQSVAFSPNQGESDGVSAGGKWMEFHSEDKMTGAKNVRFELLADNYLREDPDYKPRIQFVCTNGKYTAADFNPGIRLGPPNRPGFWGQPQMEVLVRVDNSHSNHGWNWIRGRFLSVDKGTTRELIGAHVFKIELRGRSGPEIAEFSPAGLDLGRVKQSCDLTPKKP